MSEMTPFVKRVHDHISWNFRNRVSTYVGVYASPENVQGVFNAIIQLIAETEKWPEPITYNYATFQIANQTLYLRCGILLEVLQRPYAHPDGGDKAWVDVDVSKYTQLFYDLTPSHEVQDGY